MWNWVYFSRKRENNNFLHIVHMLKKFWFLELVWSREVFKAFAGLNLVWCPHFHCFYALVNGWCYIVSILLLIDDCSIPCHSSDVGCFTDHQSSLSDDPSSCSCVICIHVAGSNPAQCHSILIWLPKSVRHGMLRTVANNSMIITSSSSLVL